MPEMASAVMPAASATIAISARYERAIRAALKDFA